MAFQVFTEVHLKARCHLKQIDDGQFRKPVGAIVEVRRGTKPEQNYTTVYKN
jgi:hypothetical protein